MNNSTITKYVWSAAAGDGATVHHEPLLVAMVHLPTHVKPVTIAYMNITKVMSDEGSKTTTIKMELFLKKLWKEQGGRVLVQKQAFFA
eukprot:scaffold219996_cov66-Attheya_sp.AAC.2